MSKIKDKVTAQLYGDPEMQEQIIAALSSAGVVVKCNAQKEYKTKVGNEGYYMALTFLYE